MLNVIVLSVVMLSVMVPFVPRLKKFHKDKHSSLIIQGGRDVKSFYRIGNLSNGKESTVIRALGGSTYPG